MKQSRAMSLVESIANVVVGYGVAVATIGAQAARLGVTIDVAEAVQKGIKPDALRASVLNQLAAQGDAASITVVPPPKSAAPESPLLAAVKRAASAAKPA